MHPSLCTRYLQFAKWEESWIKTAVEMAKDMWHDNYKPQVAATEAATSSATTSQFGYLSYMDLMMADTSSGTEVEKAHDCPVHEFVYADPIRDKSTKPHSLLNPLTWWYGQCVLGNEHSGLMQMVLDILSAPATSVDVEHAFSFVGLIVSKCHHRLAPCTVEVLATLGSYSKAGLVQHGVLAQVQAEDKAAKKAAALAASGSSKPAQQAST
ncbi:hypothetical protein FS749_001616 [Ceratobasidium sp. UAMH 11750]|nr:hypothetical protein FS749_001616 [Ceratobasidium sp. UAMH 11750]